MSFKAVSESNGIPPREPPEDVEIDDVEEVPEGDGVLTDPDWDAAGDVHTPP